MKPFLPTCLLAALGALGSACGGTEAHETIEDRPLEQAEALDAIQEALSSRNCQSARFVPVLLPNRHEWTVDVAGTSMPIAIEFLTAQDRERVGDALPIQATPNETPRVVVVQRVGPDGQPAGKLYLRVFTDEHFRFQPNPPADMMETPYTIREVTARLKRDVMDFVAWHVGEHGAETPPP